MDRLKKLFIIENEVEAQRLQHALKARSIPHLIKSYRDSVYDGIFQLQLGWGHLEAPEYLKAEIEELYRDLFGRKPKEE